MKLNRLLENFQGSVFRRKQNENFDMIEAENNNRIKDIALAMKRISNLILRKSDWPEIVDARLRYDGKLYDVLYDHLADTDKKLDSVLDTEFDYSTINPIFHAILSGIEGTVLQAPVWDEETEEIYISQVNGLTSGVESFTISRLDKNGAYIDSMALKYGGHGTSFGIERENGKVYIWTNYEVVDATGKVIDHEVVRVQYKGGTTINSVEETTIYDRFNNHYTSVVTDVQNGLIAFRINATGKNDVIELRSLSDVKKGINKILGSVTIPSDLMYMQGMTIDNYDLYWRTGDTNSANYPDELCLFSFIDGKIKKRITCSFGKNNQGVYENNFREPEGIFLYKDKKTGKKTLFASVVTGGQGKRIIKIYAYHQKGNHEKFASILMQGAQYGVTGANSKSAGVSDTDKLLSDINTPNQETYIRSEESFQFPDHPAPGTGGYWLKNGSREPNGSMLQFMFRNSVGRPVKIFVRVVPRDEAPGEFVALPSGQDLDWIDLPLQNGASNPDSNAKTQYCIDGNEIKFRGEMSMPTANGTVYGLLPSGKRPNKNVVKNVPTIGTTGTRTIVFRSNGEIVGLGYNVNEPENMTGVYFDTSIPLG
ncbi:teichoic acid biosynthesis protein [Niallia sp. FSL W8-0951]|uniref:phage baseplate protein n=1 Tax=Niallia sp. FSL W8-0951 TaxID=2954639 RepID=UPI0030F789C8